MDLAIAKGKFPRAYVYQRSRLILTGYVSSARLPNLDDIISV